MLSASSEQKFHTYCVYVVPPPSKHTYISHPSTKMWRGRRCSSLPLMKRQVTDGRCRGMPWRWLFAKLCGRQNSAGHGREKKVFFSGDSSLCPAAGQGVLRGVRPGSIAAEQPVSLSACLSLCASVSRDIWFSNCENVGALFF